jgi:hypothetical protein
MGLSRSWPWAAWPGSSMDGGHSSSGWAGPPGAAASAHGAGGSGSYLGGLAGTDHSASNR